MIAYLLDTGVVSQPTARRPNARVLSRLTQVQRQCAIAAPVWHELRYGCARLPPSHRRDALEEYLRGLEALWPILPYDAAAAVWHASERARLDRRGRGTPHVDGEIAAIAAVNDLTLVTDNTRHFAAFKGVRVERWS